MESIYYVHFKQDGDFDLLLNDFCDVLNLTFPEIIGGNDDVPETPPSSPQRVLYNEAERRIRCLATFAAFLKTPHQFFKDPEIISPQILGLYDILVGGKVHVAEGDEPQAENRPQHGI